MPNIALYRKYRPRTFAEVFGQEQVTEPLMAALRNDKLNHAYLFSGPRGCGKTSSARILARSVNCEKGPTPEPCGECDSCRALAPDGPGSIDVIEIDAASHGGVDDARELREKAFFAPVNSRYKVYVIDEAHMVSSAGFNALLKLVEEPPEYVMFVFATTEPDKVLGTIKSRTHHYPFRLVPPGVMREHLESVCAKEGVKVDPAVFPLVVRAGGGSVRDSQSIMDQLLAGADESGVSYPRAVALLGVTDVELIDAAVDGLATSDGGALFGAVDRVVEAGHDPRRFASDLLERLRDLIVLNQVPDAAGKGLLAVPPDEVDRLTAQARRLGPATLSRMADILHEGLASMRGATSPRLVLEVLCARMLLPGDDSTADLLQRLETLEQRITAGGAVPLAAGPGQGAPAGPAAAVPAQAAAPRPTAPAPTEPAPGEPAPVRTAPAEPASPAAPDPASAASATGPSAPAPAAPPTTATPAAPSAPAAPSTASGPATAAPASVAAAPATAPAPVAAGVPQTGAGSGVPAAPGEVDLATVEAHWSAVLAEVKRRRQMVWAILGQNAGPYALDGDTLVLKARNAGTAARLNDDSLASVIQDAVQTVLHHRLRIRCEANPAGSSRPAAQRSAPPAAAPTPPAASAPPTAPATPAAPVSEVGGWPEITRPGGPAAPPAGQPDGGTGPSAAPSSNGAAPTGSATVGSTPNGAGPAEPGALSAGTGAGAGVGVGVGNGPVASAVRTAPGPGEPAAVAATPAGAVATMPRPASAPDWLPDGPTDFSPDDPVPVSLGGTTPVPGGAATPPPAPAADRSAATALDGFAPGDEPTDEPFDPASAPKPISVEDRAVSLLVQKLGAEPLD
ncbi:hypothetical protein Athai_66610 [Actinocatenispora thailandica]|uniref:DNA polymerase III subunit gamma/tau n=1 Tax=Actinocatenispora thailandica TaxID=227318 RepID=A0A7R7I1L0_9ACTN|nr:DNA polymerase III subunit gamma and tau [Actinocatenispora thailandica]BCJ39158.1 hypothetical protein Athai_66610 [Actinocatenispora thailandica]